MPACHINVLAGHPRESLKQLLREVSASYAEILDAPKNRLEVWITEIDPDLWAIEGVPASEVLLTRPRHEVEMPFVQMILLEGRPVEQFHRVIESITEIIGRVLSTDPSRIRIHIAGADPDRWGIGGTPASITRATEIAARAAGNVP